MNSCRDSEIVQADRDFKARSSPAQKATVHDAFASILEQLGGIPRGPDTWEEACLVHALSYMEAGLYDRALTEVRECVVPVGERSSWRESQIKRNPQRYTLPRLRLRFETLKAGLG